MPANWYSSTYGGAVANDGTGAGTITGAIFTSTGALGSVGTVKDTLGDVAGKPRMLLTSATTGETIFSTNEITKLGFTTSAQSITAGVASSVITVQTRDATGAAQNVTSGTAITLTSTSGTGRFDTSSGGAFDGSITSVTIANGTSSANLYYKDTAAGTPTITADESVSHGWTAATQQETVNAAAISKIAFTTTAQTLTAGSASAVMTIQTQDAYNNPSNVSGNTTIALSSTAGTGRFDTGAGGSFDGSVTSVTMESGSSSASFYYKDAATGTPTITADESPSAGWTAATQQETVNAATISKLAFTTSAQTLTTGSASAIMTIQTQDSGSNPSNVSSNTTISLSSTSGTGRFDTSAGGSFDGSITSVSITSGSSTASFYYKDTAAGTPTITADESVSQGWTAATQQETVNAAPISKIVFTTTAQTLTAGSASAVITIQTQDTYSNPSNVSSNTTIALSSTSGTGRFDTSAGGTFNGSVTSVTITSGTSTASFYYKDTATGTPTITADESPSAGWTAGTQQETVGGGAITKIAFTTDVQTLTAGSASAIITIQTQDASSNPSNVSGNTTIALSSTSGTGRFDTSSGGSFDGSITSVTITSGSSTASFYYKDTATGTPTITADESPSQSWTAATQQETVNAAAISKIAFTTTAQTLTAGSASAVITIQTQDASSNPSNVSGNTTIALSSTSGTGRFDTSAGGSFDGSITSVIITSGSSTASFYYRDTAAGTPTVTADESPSAGWTAGTQQETVNATAISKIAFTTTAQTLSVGSASAVITIQTQDTYNNPSNVSANTTIALSSTAGTGRFDTSSGGAFNGSVTSVIITSGSSTASFYYKDTATGTPTITADESPSAGWTAGTQQETVNAAAISKIVFTTDAQTLTAGSASAVITIQTQDSGSNPSNVSSNTTISLTSTSGTGRFDTSAGGSFDGSITSVTITSGSSTASFYYKDTAAGTPTITADESPSQSWTAATQQETVNAAAISKIVFTTNAQAVSLGAASAIITIQTQDTYNNPSNVSGNTTIALSSTAGTGRFDTSAGGCSTAQ